MGLAHSPTASGRGLDVDQIGRRARETGCVSAARLQPNNGLPSRGTGRRGWGAGRRGGRSVHGEKKQHTTDSNSHLNAETEHTKTWLRLAANANAVGRQVVGKRLETRLA